MFKVKSFDVNHPNPIFYRKSYTILNGIWDFCFDKNNKGEKQEYFKQFPEPLKINVPFAYNTPQSGINEKKIINRVWYKKEIEINSLEKDYILHFEGVDYLSKLYINGEYVMSFKGAYIRHSANITKFLSIGTNSIVLSVYDSLSTKQPRGKQRFLKKNFMCWYEETTGIYKDVWLEEVPKNYIESFHITPNRDTKTVDLGLKFNGINDNLTVNIYYKDEKISSNVYKVSDTIIDLSIKLKEIEEWNVLDPKLYDIEFIYGYDVVLSYFAFRSLKAENKKVYLNDKELYQKLVLDQGYFNESLLTPSSPSDLFKDIDLSIEFGFNGARKHQKREDDRYYAYADMMGFILWAEMPSAYKANNKAYENLRYEWEIIVNELYNHPSIICWTPINESWGVYLINKKKKERDFVNSMYDLTKSIDPYRFCLTNDGWEHTKSDFLTIHLYSQDRDELNEWINIALNKGIVKSLLPYKYHTYVKGFKYNDEPIIISEFGGTAYASDKSKDWGYGKSVMSDEEYINRLTSLFNTLKNVEEVSGYCYTQITDVRQEINGLLTMDRTPKVNPEIIKSIQER